MRGNLIERVVVKEVSVPKGSVEHKRQHIIDIITKKVASYEIAPSFGNLVVKLIKNPKIPKRWKKVKEKRYIQYGNAEFKFKRSAQTDLNQLKLLQDIIKDFDAVGVDDERQKSDLCEEFKRRALSYYWSWPKEVLSNPTLRKPIETNEQALRRWYSEYRHIPDWEVKKMPIETLKHFLDEQINLVQGSAKPDSQNAFRQASGASGFIRAFWQYVLSSKIPNHPSASCDIPHIVTFCHTSLELF